MNSSPTITKISIALVKAQKEMGNAVKGSANPFFKSKYADLNAVREAVLPVFNNNGISVIQPTCVIDGKNYVETILLHESGEFLSGVTEIISDKPNDAQKHGSGLSYARRYGLSSIAGIGAEDDDANHASSKQEVKHEKETDLEKAIMDVRAINGIDGLKLFIAAQPENIRSSKSFQVACKNRQEILKNNK